jgi:hypothetical protein
VKTLENLSSWVYPKFSDFYHHGQIEQHDYSVLVNPKLISHGFKKKRPNYRYSHSHPKGNPLRKRQLGVVFSGFWDLGKYSVKKNIFYIDFKNYLLHGTPWENSLHYKLYFEYQNFKANKNLDWSHYKAKKIDKYIDIYNEIIKSGYKSQAEFQRPSSNEIQVGITRNGQIRFIDGRHRLAIAQILKLDEIPVIINLVHKKYYNKLLKLRLKMKSHHSLL